MPDSRRGVRGVEREPRIRLNAERLGLRSYAVPATMSRRLALEPSFVAREIAAYHVALLLR